MPIEFSGAARRVTRTDVEAAAAMLRVTVATMRAVMDVESRNSGYDAKKRPTILFEPHVFYRNLPAGAKRDRAVKAGIAYKDWRPGNYPRGSAIKQSDGNYQRLAAAIEIDEEAACRAISIGLGQVLGENYKAAGHQSARAMFDSAKESEGEQLRQMASFIRDMGLANELRRKDWAGFARRYNGPGYAKNKYDQLLAKAHAKWSTILAKPREELTAKDLRAAGSQTIAATTDAKAAVQIVTAAGATASAAMTQAGDVVSQARDLSEGVKVGAGWLELAKSYWPLLLIILATAIAGYFAWRIWRAAHRAEQARVDDERANLGLGRL